MNIAQITIRGKVVRVVGSGSKADIARALLDEGYTVSEISKAVPMAYSQVHSIAQKTAKQPESSGKAGLLPSPSWGRLPSPRPRSTKPVKVRPPLSPRVGKLRTPGLPSDTDLGPCANCGHDVALRPLPTGYTLIHINVSAEEYLATTQFCQAVPRSLIQ